MKKNLFLFLVGVYSLGLYAQTPSTQTSTAVTNGKSETYKIKNIEDDDQLVSSDDLQNAVSENSVVVSTTKQLPAEKNVLPIVDRTLVKPMTTNSLGSTYAVGAIQESSSVNQNGSSSVNVNIDVPKDPLGFTPQVSLSYNSMGSASNLGWGWSLQAISFIARSGKNFYYDGSAAGVNVDDNQNTFTLDGVRLIHRSFKGATDTYKSEKGNAIAIATFSGNSITSFTVKYPNGNIAYFKKSDENGFYLTEAVDAFNHHIYYSYEDSNSGPVLSTISYNNQKCQIKFTYKQISSNYVFQYSRGVKKTFDKLLDRITVTNQPSLLKTYIVNYKINSGRYQIDSIRCQSGGSELYPLKFTYGDGNNEKSFEQRTAQMSNYFKFEDPSDFVVQRAKFKYGTASDGIIVYPNHIANLEVRRHSTMFRHSQDYLVNQYSETQEIIVADGVESNFAFNKGKLTAGKGFQGIICGDIDKKQGEEVIKINEYLEDGHDYTELTTYVPNVYGGLYQTHHFKETFNDQLTDCDGKHSILPKNMFIGDFNGDGVNEILAVSPQNVLGSDKATRLYIIDMVNGTTLYQNDAPFAFNQKYPSCNKSSRNISITTSPDEADWQSDKIFINDVDGDGKSDIVLITSDGTHTYSLNSSGSNILSCSQIAVDNQLQTSTCNRRKIQLADLNGDNLADFVLTPQEKGNSKYSSDYIVYFSKGDGTYEKAIKSNFPSYRDGITDFFEDVDLDGTSDYVVYTHNTGDLNVYTFRNGELSGTLKYNIGKNNIVIPADISSYSKISSILAVQSDGTIKKLIYNGNELNNLLLAGYTNSFGIAKEFKYRNLFNSTSIQGHNAEFPFINYNGPLVITTNYKETTNNATVTDLNYRYENAVLHKQGRGFRGYEKIYTNNAITGENQTDVYDIYNDCLLLSSSNNCKNVTNTYNYKIGYDKINYTTLKKSVSEDKATGLTTTTNYTYDSYGNVTEMDVDYGNGYKQKDSYTYSNINNYSTYVNNYSTYVLGLVASETHESDRNGRTSNSKIVNTYYGVKLIQKKQYINGSNLVNTTDYEYNDDGLKTKVTNTSFDSNIRHSTCFTYNPYGYVTSKTGEDGLTEKYRYNEKSQISGIENYLGTSKLEYDSFGNLVKTTNPDGTLTEIKLSWDNSNPGFCYSKLVKATGKPNEITYYDVLGRKVREGHQRYDGSYLYVDNKYNQKGQLIETTEPFKTSATKKTTYSYDEFNRLTQVNKSNGSCEEHSYGKLSTTVKENGKSTTKRYNELGDLLSVESDNGDVSYEYDKNGDVSKITSPGGVDRAFRYDAYGRKTSIDDPTVGIRTLTYNKEGKVTKELSSDTTKAICYSYDNMGRITSKAYSNYVMLFDYNRYGEIVSERKSDNTYSKTTTYDKFHRPSKVVIRNEGCTLTLDYTYSNGNVATVTYTTGKGLTAKVSYSYKNGVMTEATLNGSKIIWKLISENDNGQATEYESLGINNKYTFDANGLLSSISTYKDNSLLLDEKYEFDPLTSNLITRSNNHGLSENFEYDQMDRLVKANNNTIDYDDLGNIIEDSQIGKYTYSEDKPYTVTSITTNSSFFPTSEQNITYNGLNRPLTIEEGSYKAELNYGTDDERSKMILYKNDEIEKVKYYIGSVYELVETKSGYTERLYLMGDAYSAPVVIVSKNGTQKLYSVVRDYLNSIRGVFDENGNLVQELSYDAWGRLRDPGTGVLYNKENLPTLFLDRGYTSHEHLNEFFLVNMNGRLYDPTLCRFLNPDPVVQDAQNGQNFNSYAYVLNNPLKYNDKSGKFCVGAIIGCIVGAYIGGLFANHKFNPLKWDYSKVSTYVGIAIGAVGGYYLGGAVAAGYIDVEFALITPFAAVGVELAFNNKGSKPRVVDYGYATCAGGGYSHSMQVATENAETAYKDAIVKAHEIIDYIDDDLSSHPITGEDVLSNTISWMENHTDEWAAQGYYSADIHLNYYSSKSEIPEGVKCWEIKDMAKRGCKAVGGFYDIVSYGMTVYELYKIIYDDRLSERDKYISSGMEIGGFVGGILGTKFGIYLSSETGPAAIGFGLVVGALGSCLGRYVGGVVGGIIYQYDSLNNSIQNEINRAQPYMQNFNYDGLMMPH